MSVVWVLHEPKMPFETRRLVGLIADRVDGVRVETLWPHRVLPLIRELVRRGTGRRVIHAFGRRALAVAVLAADASILFSPTRFPTRGDVAWVRAALRYREVKIICGSDADRRRWVSGGVPMDRCRLMRPGASTAQPANARAEARARFGLTDDDRVLFTPLAIHGNARATAVWTGCLLNVLDPRAKTIAWADGGHGSVERLESTRTRLINPSACFVMPEDNPAAGFAACDAILLPPDELVPPTIIAMAMASGRPIVARTTAQVCELLEDRHTALLTSGLTANSIAKRVLDVFEDEPRARQIADQARAEAYEYFAVSRLLNDCRTLYAGAAKEPAGDASTAAAAACVGSP